MKESALIDLACRLLLREEQTDDISGETAGPGRADPRVQVFMDRVLLRFFSTPSVVVYLRDARAHGNGVIELVFSELPERIVPKVAELVGVQGGEVYAFNDEDTQYPCTGYRFKPRKEDLEGINL